MTSPESPAVQDTDRLREVAARTQWQRDRLGEVVFGEWDDADEGSRREYLLDADAVLAAVLPVHREMVGREIFNALSEEIAWQREKYADGSDKAATGRMVGMADAAITVRRLAVSAPPTPPGSPPADERATAVETRVERPFVPCELGVAGDWCALPIEHAGSCNPTVAVPGTGDDPPKRNTVKVRPPEDRRILLNGQKAARDTADALGVGEYDDSIGDAAAVSVFNAMRAERDELREVTAALTEELSDFERELLAEPATLAAYVRARHRRFIQLIAEKNEARAERDRLAETIRRAHLLVDQLNEQGTTKVTAAIVAALLAAALGDIPSPTVPDAPDRTEEQWTMRYLLNGEPQLAEDNGHIFDSRAVAEQHIDAWRTFYPNLLYTDVEYLRRTVTYGPWQPAPVEPEGTPDVHM